MSEVYPEANGLSKGISAEVIDGHEPVMETEEQYKLRMYYASKAHELSEYYKFIDSCREQAQVVRGYYTENPGHPKNEVPVWERGDVSEDDKFQARLKYDLEKFTQEGKEFSPAALAVTSSFEAAEFFDRVKCEYLGHSDNLGWFKEMSPDHNESPFDIQFEYDVGILNAYTASGNILHIRETRDPEARTREQRQLVLGMNILTREITRYYAEDYSTIIPANTGPYRFDEMITLQPRKLSALSGGLELDPKNTFAPLYQKAMEDASRQNLAKILYSDKGTRHFKAEGMTTTFETLHSIGDLDKERSLLSGLARAAGMRIGERGVILDYHLQSRIAA